MKPAAALLAVLLLPGAGASTRPETGVKATHDGRTTSAAEVDLRPRPRPVRASRGGVRHLPTHDWRAVAMCESRMRRDAVGGTDAVPTFSYLQWTLDTWRRAGGRGDPRDAPWPVQVQLAERWLARTSWRQWPNCGRVLALIEREPSYLPLIVARLSKPIPLTLTDGAA